MSIPHLGRATWLAGIAFSFPGAQLLALSQRADEPGAQPAPVQRVWGDADGDSLVDLYVVHPTGEDRLFLNRGDGTFLDVTAVSGLAGRLGTLSAAWEDFDRNGRPDLLIVTRAGELLVFRGEGGGTFLEVAGEIGITSRGFVRSAEWMDYDADGRLDLAVIEDGRGPVFYHRQGDRAFVRVELTLPAGIPVPRAEVLSESDPDLGAPSGGSRTSSGEPTTSASAPERSLAPANAADRASIASTPPSNIDPSTEELGADRDSPAIPTCLLDEVTLDCVPVSSVPRLGALYPLGDEFFIDPSGNITMGAGEGSRGTAGAAGKGVQRLYVRIADAAGLAVLGENTATAGPAGGLRGEVASSSGRGVVGRASSLTGATEGVRGESASPAGRGVGGVAPAEGVRGQATATSGVARGVSGTSASADGEGVLGEASETTGDNVGVRGRSASPAGRGIDGSAPSEGVRGQATATSGVARGVSGTSASADGEGVLGESTSRGGANVGVRGTSASPAGRGVEGRSPREGVRGEAMAIGDSEAVGIRGVAASLGTGVLGESPYRGVHGRSDYGGEGVLGECTDLGGGVGVRGTSASVEGRGVEGRAPSIGVLGHAIGGGIDDSGVLGTTDSMNGRGVTGIAPREGVRGIATGEPGGDIVGVRGSAFSDTGSGVLGLLNSSGSFPPSTFGAGVRGHVDAGAGGAEVYGVCGSSEGLDSRSAGVLAAGNGAHAPGQPRAAALEISNGAFVVSGDVRPAGTFEPGPLPWSPLRGCSGPTTVGYYADLELSNPLITDGGPSDEASILLVTVETSHVAERDVAYFAQVWNVRPGLATIRLTVVGVDGPCAPPSPADGPRVNYLILNSKL